MSTTLDGTVAVLWGSATKELNWVHLSPDHGRVSVARAHAGGCWVRETYDVPGVEEIFRQARFAWTQIKAGEDMSYCATHRLVPPSMQDIEQIHE